MNLVINARDPMPNGGARGALIRPCSMKNHVAAHATARPGRFVCITVTDTVAHTTGDHAANFRTFFTTKEIARAPP